MRSLQITVGLGCSIPPVGAEDRCKNDNTDTLDFTIKLAACQFRPGHLFGDVQISVDT